MNREQRYKTIAREIDFVDGIMRVCFDDYGEETHRALQEAVKIISALSAEGEKKCSECIHSAERDGEFCYECVKGNEDNFVSAEGEYIRKEDATKALSDHFMYLQRLKHDEGNGCKKYEQAGINWCLNTLNELPTYSFSESKRYEYGTDGHLYEMNISNGKEFSFPDREKGEQLYSDLLRVKHGTMNIDSLIDKVYEDMRGKANE